MTMEGGVGGSTLAPFFPDWHGLCPRNGIVRGMGRKDKPTLWAGYHQRRTAVIKKKC